MAKQYKILIVDDDRELLIVLRMALDMYLVIDASDVPGALYQLKAEKPDLAIIDLGLPGTDGMLLISQIRGLTRNNYLGPIPIIILSGRAEQVDRVMALRSGADDFISKPFDLFDLEARVEAVLKRSTRPKVEEHVPDITRLGALEISDAYGHFYNHVPFHLTPTEHRILLLLVQQEGTMITRADIATSIFGYNDRGSNHIVDVHVMRLRKRLRELTDTIDILTVRRHGFLIHEVSQTVAP